ncbi:hypothetical protein RHMOL_Rhmol05G0277700 [Rhododendron molle]|uniref:Uncharacterized protein n=1 Tax=Rhododendron molle TaxID=49168 RepID=A0ACC0NTY7_RHOML|nr:hypothetical protein RHMOL_Rhmol05G0277700 [Rhododendron molle]
MAAPIFFCLQLLCFAFTVIRTRAQPPGTWELLVQNAGIASMHTAVTRWNTVVLIDRTDIGASNLSLPNGVCRIDPNDLALTTDCYAHSALLDLETNTIRPLMILTDTWCSSGQFLPDGTLLHSGGWNDGNTKFRTFTPCINTSSCDWEELPNTTSLHQGDGDNEGDNMYPYVHLLPQGNLFIFANNQSVLYDYVNNTVVLDFPQLEGGSRSYPSAGSSAMLALEGNYSTATIIICGGAQYDAFNNQSVNSTAKGSCGRIVATDPNPIWEMEEMPLVRIMGDMVMLPTGDVLIINGAQAGSQGYGLATNQCLTPVLYQPDQLEGSPFVTLNPGSIPRLYHSTANLLPDGRVLLSGSNTHYYYTFDGDFPTELRIEAFSPEYLAADNTNLRPVVTKTPKTVQYGNLYNVYVTVSSPISQACEVEVNFASAPFATHSFSQGQRLVKLGVTRVVSQVNGEYRIVFQAPPNGMVAPPGYYMMFVVNQGVPSVARWVQLTS